MTSVVYYANDLCEKYYEFLLQFESCLGLRTCLRTRVFILKSKIHVIIRVETFQVDHFDANKFYNSHSYRSG